MWPKIVFNIKGYTEISVLELRGVSRLTLKHSINYMYIETGMPLPVCLFQFAIIDHVGALVAR